ncbi:uncharacterized protein [Palaemon carinicauda]|uniref:uncharacterized protein n=1 Tax=Palaemon carinicauda TaxID=392227 RepID=UPI0035B6394E
MYNFDLLVDEFKNQKRLLGKINKEADLALSKNDCNVGLLQDVANRLQIELKNIDITLSKVKESEIPEVDIVQSLEYNYQEICFESHTRLTILKEKMKHEQEDKMSNVSLKSKSSSSRSHHTSVSKSSRVSSTKRIELSTKLAGLGTERKYHDIMEKARADLKKFEIDKEIEATNAEICAVNKILEEENETDPQSCLSFPLGENNQPTEGLLHRYLEDSRVVNYSLSGSSVQKSLSFAGGLDSIDKDLDKRKAEIKPMTDLNPNAQKLPAQIAERWNCIVTKRITIDEEEYSSFEEFTRVISDEANKACNPTLSYSALNRRDTVFTPKKKQPQSKVAKRTSFATKFNEVNNVTNAASDENKSKNEKQTESKMNVGFTCYYCRQNHDMEKCPEFSKLDLAQRNQYLTDKKMCRGCFKVGHYSRYCKRSRKCIKCKRWHPTILHDETLNKKPSSGDTQQEQAIAVTNRINVNRYFSADVHSMIVPVWLSHRNTNNKVMVYAVLNDQSDACFIKESVLRYMNVNGQNSVIKIATLLGEEAIKSTKVFGLSVKGINENSTVNLPCVNSRKTTPARRAQIPKKCSALRWPHLKKIAGRLISNNIFTVPTKVKEVHAPHHVREMFESDFISNVSDDEVALSVEKRQFIEIVSNGIKIIDGKQFKIPLPLKGGGIQFPDNKLVVQKRLSNLKQKLQKNGPDLSNSLAGILCRFRNHSVAITCDVEAMYHQVLVNEEHRNLLRFLWFDNHDLDGDIVQYRMTVHLFGARSSPSVANYALKAAADRFKDKTTEKAAEFIKEHFYVDDGLKSVATVEEAINLAKDIQMICKRGGFHLQKFVANNAEVLKATRPDEVAQSVKNLDLTKDKLPVERTLELRKSEITSYLNNGDMFPQVIILLIYVEEACLFMI